MCNRRPNRWDIDQFHSPLLSALLRSRWHVVLKHLRYQICFRRLPIINDFLTATRSHNLAIPPTHLNARQYDQILRIRPHERRINFPRRDNDGCAVGLGSLFLCLGPYMDAPKLPSVSLSVLVF